MTAGIRAFVPNSEVPSDYEFGAFADGGDAFARENLQAPTGAATYTGRSIGVSYVKDRGEAGPFGANVALTASFGNAEEPGSISGTVSDIVTRSGSLAATLNPGSASIGSSDSGFFTGGTGLTFEGRTYAGRRGGQFFGNVTSTDAPSSVARTFGAATSEGTGSGSLVGAFGAERQTDQ